MSRSVTIILIQAGSVQGCIVGANLVIPAQICYELSCGKSSLRTDERTDGRRQRQYPFGLEGHVVKMCPRKGAFDNMVLGWYFCILYHVRILYHGKQLNRLCFSCFALPTNIVLNEYFICVNVMLFGKIKYLNLNFRQVILTFSFKVIGLGLGIDELVHAITSQRFYPRNVHIVHVSHVRWYHTCRWYWKSLGYFSRWNRNSSINLPRDAWPVSNHYKMRTEPNPHERATTHIL